MHSSLYQDRNMRLPYSKYTELINTHELQIQACLLMRAFFTGQITFFFLKVILCIITLDAIYFGMLLEKILYWETRLRRGYSFALEKRATSVVSI